MKKWRRRLFFLVLLFLAYQVYRIRQDVQQVMTYQGMVREVLAEYDTKVNEELVLAVIYTETKGQEADVMQSSESATGYANAITDQKESVRKGVELLTQNLVAAEEAGVDEWTAVQAYNYGPAYIDYIAEHGGKNTLALARIYSRDILAPSLGNTDQETYVYYHPLALFSGGKLYVNGGNIYYSRQVWLHLHLIKWVNVVG